MKKIAYALLVLVLVIGNVHAYDYYKLDPFERGNVDVKIIEYHPYTFENTKNYKVKVRVWNLGENTGQGHLECGIYTDEQLRDWGIPLMFIPVANCKNYETNVDTVQVILSGNTHEDIELIIPKVPDAGVKDRVDDFYLLCGLYIDCYGQDTNNNGKYEWGYLAYDKRRVYVFVNSLTADPNDHDGIKNNGETDTDCGGPNAKPCDDGYLCVNNDDCKSGYCGIAVDGQRRCMQIPDDNGNGKIDAEEYKKYTGKDPLDDLKLMVFNVFAFSKYIFVLIILGFAGFLLFKFRRQAKAIFNIIPAPFWGAVGGILALLVALLIFLWWVM